MKHRFRHGLGILCAALMSGSPALAQQAPQARVAESAVGQAGQRQTAARTQAQIQAEPMARINSRIPNRVQNRIRNRIDRNYNPQANATSPFDVAADQVRAPGARIGR